MTVLALRVNLVMLLVSIFPAPVIVADGSDAPVQSMSNPEVFHTLSEAAPARGQTTVIAVRESDQMVARVLRLAPEAAIREHHHPYFDETFFVHSGSVTMILNDREKLIRAGDVVYMPSGTIISGRNAGPEEAVIVVVWANLGEKGPLFVYGRPDTADAQ